VSGNWGLLLAELVAPAMLVAWSPMKIIPALILVLNSSRPKPTALAFLAAWLVGLASVTAVFISAPRLFDSLPHTSIGKQTSIPLAIAIGVLLIVVAGYRWATRDRIKKSPEWLSRFTQINPFGGALLGLVLAVAIPKVVAMSATAGVAIGNASLGGVGAALALLYYTALAGSTIVVPVVGYLLAADTVNRWLVNIRLRLQRHQNVVTTVMMASIGSVLVGTGLAAM
jgi:Sap, sulfolipid-1-addressing protein